MQATLKYPFSCNLLVIQPTPFCNLACNYCYLRDKDNSSKISLGTLTSIINDVLNSGLISKETTLVWHAGEPLTIPIEYFRSLLECVKKNDFSNYFRHSIQTNAITINDAWCDLFEEYNIDIGISIDGPKSIHDSHRVNRKGNGTFEQTLQGLELIRKKGLKHHVISVITAESLINPEETLKFFTELGVKRVGFNIEEIEGVNTGSSAYDEMTSIKNFFKLAHELHVSTEYPISIREFDQTYKLITLSPNQQKKDVFVNTNSQVRPFGLLNVDYLGNYSTFSPELLGQHSEEYDNFIFGNAMDQKQNLQHMLDNKNLIRVFQDIQKGVKMCSESCQYFTFCGGGCPSNKLYENGTFASTETFHCKSMIQEPFNIVLEALETHI
jgi:uncharacterized protein